MKLNGWLCGTFLVLAAACAGDGARDASADRAARDSAAPAAGAAAAASEASAPRSNVPPAAPAPQSAREQPPTREDSVAAAAEDVSPEWKQRAREMGNYPHCMQQASQADPPMRARLENACSRLPDAP